MENKKKTIPNRKKKGRRKDKHLPHPPCVFSNLFVCLDRALQKTMKNNDNNNNICMYRKQYINQIKQNKSKQNQNNTQKERKE